MIRALALLLCLQAPPVVIDTSGAPAHAVIVTYEGRAWQVMTVPVDAPAPAPQPGPTPDPAPAPAPETFGPVARLMVLHESALVAGDEPYLSVDFLKFVRDLVPPQTDGSLAYRRYDYDADLSRQPNWAALKDAVMPAIDRAKGPHLVAMDAKGRTRVIPIVKGMTVGQLIDAVRNLR